MNIIVPMAGRGSRLRPHTLPPKTHARCSGNAHCGRLVHIVKFIDQPVNNISFILGDPVFLGDEMVDELQKLAESLGAKAHIFRQLEALGTGHAIMCAEPLLNSPTVIAYADTLIRSDFGWTTMQMLPFGSKKVKNPEAYGVVKINDQGDIKGLVENQQTMCLIWLYWNLLLQRSY